MGEKSDLIPEKIKLIAESYNNYICKYSCFEKNRGIKKVKTNDNYFAEIMHYLLDTISLIKVTDQESDIDVNIFHHVGLLQIIYVQQDLMGEMLEIFECTEDSDEREENRRLRNELIGHPISTPWKNEKDKYDDIKSTVLWDLRVTTNENICYTKYSFEKNNHQRAKIFVELGEVIGRHIAYLNKNLDIILKNIKSNFLHQIIINNNISRIRDVLGSKRDNFEELTRLANRYFDLAKSEILFSEKWLIEFKRRENDHPRYKFACSYFMEYLKKQIDDITQDIDTLSCKIDRILQGLIGKEYPQSIPVKTFVPTLFVESEREQQFPKSAPDNTLYFLDNLLSKDREMGSISFRGMKEQFRTNKTIIDELEYMENNIVCDSEYYSAYFFLRNCLVYPDKFRADYSIDPNELI